MQDNLQPRLPRFEAVSPPAEYPTSRPSMDTRSNCIGCCLELE